MAGLDPGIRESVSLLTKIRKMMSNPIAGARIHITGIVQGVGFRPFVFTQANRLGLTGWVRNTSAGVDIEVDGTQADLQAFIHALRYETPPLARIDEITVEDRPVNGFTAFEIVHSVAIQDAFQPISPDVCICPDCLRELFDPTDRRYRYPFTNCTNCGPRFTIIEDIPYDRPNTTMASFPMCPECDQEYHNPLDRRFHAQPVACPTCGPQIWLELTDSPESVESASRGDTALLQAQQLLTQGKILAIKGLGGFHLACDATNQGAVVELRQRKLRVDKPFALMMLDTTMVETHCLVSDDERELLESHPRPIVLLSRQSKSSIAREVAPGQNTLGVMLPYTPLHYLLLTSQTTNPMPPLVMTSGNLAEEPIAFSNEEARQRLSGLVYAFLMHDRPIRTRCDDSVVRVFSTGSQPERAKVDHSSRSSNDPIYPVRRSRGYAPFPVHLPWETPPILATGAELKNTFCLTHGAYAFLSHHIGDLENFETLQSFEDGIAHFERLFRATPEALAYDLHPNYLATRYALERSGAEQIPSVGVQHHHAHITACMADNGLDGKRPVIGVALDGTGYGDDGCIWGGEIMLVDYESYTRLAHLKYLSLPGGDKAVKEPWRVALAWLDQAGIAWEENLPPVKYAHEHLPPHTLQAIHHQLATRINSPLTSSMGRLFDAAAALAGVRATVNYEAQAAIEFEAIADPGETGAYDFETVHKNGDNGYAGLIIDPTPVISQIVSDINAGVGIPAISARFHHGVAKVIAETAGGLARQHQITQIALSGGVWQNMTLLRKVCALLDQHGLEVLIHRQVPANDGGIALGQAVVAINQLMKP